MSIAIHHGPPGSYKTFTLVQRHAIDALKAGRVIVTNIRGFDDIERVRETYPKIQFPETAAIISVDTKSREGLALLARWFHWAPFGSLILIDEAQAVYPMRRDFKLDDLDKFDNPGIDIEQTFNGEARPRDIHLAFDMHRHFNWDLFLSTPNISKINKIIRQTTEWAYKHRDISGLLPWYKNKWIEIQHDPETTGKSITGRVGTPVKYQADLDVFKCYSSTATGEHKESIAGRSVFSDPKILGIIVVVAISIIVFINVVGSMSFVEEPIKIDKVDCNKNPDSPGCSHNNSGGDFFSDKTVVVDRSTGGGRSASKPSPSPVDRIAAIYRRLSFSGFTDDDLPKLSSSCSFSRNSIRCPILPGAVNNLLNSYCIESKCFAVFSRARPVEQTASVKPGFFN